MVEVMRGEEMTIAEMLFDMTYTDPKDRLAICNRIRAEFEDEAEDEQEGNILE